MTQTSRSAAAPERQRDKERTRQEILDVAIREFARNGYSGARVDEIAARTRMSNRHTFGAIFGLDMLDSERRDQYRTMVGDMIVSYLTTPSPHGSLPDRNG